MNDPRRIDDLLASTSGIASIRHLTAAGISAHHVRAAIADGRAERVRQGWIAGPTAPAEAVRAVRVGGWLTCLSALRMHGVWCADDDRLHVRVD
ncbi:type IV toxin-antitoxin system AbiEi family antitoxin domain-containing protein [Subtercola boreus]|uniref:type IV toxin-antitoxin system AbiEi family antitoxin domain-containing protein n=1 Tax=Subtercola boreus TaxID=120213 RepID=UPI000E2F7718|nr:type IV toxin-antitoxin system AbiEi family antitoxin domain-containing protein [Subtercola boreus]